jgi:hypothetical protein
MGCLGTLRRSRKGQEVIDAIKQSLGLVPKLPPKWEYRIMPLDNIDDPESSFMENGIFLDALGALRWELVCISHNHMIFKRHAET